MKTELTTEQSKHLIELGVPKEKASEIKEYNDQVLQWTHRGAPIFTLTDLLDILPKEIDYEEYLSEFTMQWNSTYQCSDVGYVYNGGFWKKCRFRHTELINALYELTVWCIENGHLKFD